MKHKFNSQFEVKEFLPRFTEEQVKNEPMLFNCSVGRAFLIGGPLTRAFLESLTNSWPDDDIVVDSRVHMLMPGFWPCIPGWHHDDVPREREDGQPNYYNPSYKSEHCMAIVGDASITDFAVGESEFEDVPLGGKYYKEWHPLVNKKIEDNELRLEKCPVGRLVFFDWQTWHQGAEATKFGWRWFIRASRNTDRCCTNEVRKQVQVYLRAPMEGW